MRLYIYSLHDTKLGVFLTPFFVRGEAEAIRAVQAALANSDSSNFSKSPGDFDLVNVGLFDDEIGFVADVRENATIPVSSLVQTFTTDHLEKVDLLKKLEAAEVELAAQIRLVESVGRLNSALVSERDAHAAKRRFWPFW